MRIKKEQSRKKIITDLVHEVGRRLKFSKVIMIAQSSAFIIFLIHLNLSTTRETVLVKYLMSTNAGVFKKKLQSYSCCETAHTFLLYEWG